MKTESNATAVLSNLTNNLATLPSPTKLSDANLKEFLNSAAVLHQFTLVDRILEKAQQDPQSKSIDGIFLRALGLIERTRARLSREEPKPEAPVQTAQREEARQFLAAELASGPRPAKDIFHAARALGISPATLYRAKTEMNIVSQQVQPTLQSADGTQPPRHWTWSLRADSQNPTDHPHENTGVR